MFSISNTPLTPAAYAEQCADDRAGALVSFEGRVRNHNEGRHVTALEYEAYTDLAVSEGTRIVEEAIERFSLLRARCIHRTGRLELGECAVWIGVCAAHREEAFRACQYIIDELKTRVPVWKKEHYTEGDSGWIDHTNDTT